MNIPYDRADLVRVLDSQSLDVPTFNKAVAKLIRNDLALNVSDRAVPGTWECRWYNNPSDATLHYRRGDAVWVNCEELADFTERNERTIAKYAASNAQTAATYQALAREGDRQMMLSFLQQVVKGYGTNQPLFYLGDVTQPIQIRVSLVDGNVYPPTDAYTRKKDGTGAADGEYWMDFFVSQTKAEVIDELENLFRAKLQDRMAEHVAKYHLPAAAPETLMANSMHCDFSNARYDQKMKSHYWYDSDLKEGFDTVVRFAKVQLADGGCQWFRLWRSGYLEHGGTVGIGDQTTQDSPFGDVTLFDQQFMKVGFAWKYAGNSQTAPTYDYPTDLMNKACYQDGEVDAGASFSGIGETARTSYLTPKMGSTYRYSLSLNGCMNAQAGREVDEDGEEAEVEYRQAYSHLTDGDNLQYHCPKTVFDQGNGGFSFVLNSEASKYSYYASGFTVPR